MELRTHAGAVHAREILHRRGSPENPLSAYEVEQKFRSVVAGCLSPSAIDQVVQLVDEIDTCASVQPLLAILAAPRPTVYVR
ncbi:hypothetical protein SDC9_152061 [bioreactor metagenome]|uniref:MmgE/PrpD family protein n=1 Tax=bioreactor metagenome TaxID=1076179 RepID=A0A645EWD7_9ZZZZ